MVNSGGGYSYIVIGYSKHIGRVFKEKIKNITFTDVFRCAKEKLEKNNLKVTRRRRLVRQEKEQRRKNRVLGQFNISSRITGQGSSQLIVEAINRLKHRQRRHYKYIY